MKSVASIIHIKISRQIWYVVWYSMEAIKRNFQPSLTPPSFPRVHRVQWCVTSYFRASLSASFVQLPLCVCDQERVGWRMGLRLPSSSTEAAHRRKGREPSPYSLGISVILRRLTPTFKWLLFHGYLLRVADYFFFPRVSWRPRDDLDRSYRWLRVRP